MADFYVTAPDASLYAGGAGDDRLIFTLASGPGGTVMTGLAANPLGGYDGVFDVPGPNDTSFTGIEHFTFYDKVGGSDAITTGSGNDVLNGGRGNDVFRGLGGMDTLQGGNGRDRLYGGEDADLLDGGRGDDVLYGGLGHDSLIGGDGNDRLYGGGGFDFIDTGTGNDVVDAGAGGDFIIAGAGDTRIRAGRGDDFVEIAFDGVKTIDGGTGRDFVFAFFSDLEADQTQMRYTMKTGVHRIVGSSENKSMITNVEDYGMLGDIDAIISGSNKNNDLISDAGDDLLTGYRGRDALFSGAGNDKLRGGRGNDDLDGGTGNDILIGGGGADEFKFTAGRDVIRDFGDNNDTILIDSSLVAPGETAQDVISNYATVVRGNVILTFDAENILTIENISNAGALVDDIILV